MTISSVSSPTSKPRIDYLDFLKAIAILLVVSCHMSIKPAPIATLAFSIQMPIFFFVSGLLTKSFNFKRKETGIKLMTYNGRITLKFIVSKIQRLLIPYFWFLTLRAFDYDKTYHYLITADSYHHGGWFLACLFLVFVIHSLISYLTFLSGKNWLEYVLYGIVFLYLRHIFTHPYCFNALYTNPLCTCHLYWYLPYFFLGTKLKALEGVLRGKTSMLIAALCIAAYLSTLFGEYKAFFGLIGFYYIAKGTYYLVNSKIKAVFSYIGQRTLEIYLIHFFLLRYFHTLYITDLMAIVALSLVICEALRYNKWVSCIVLGTKLPAGSKQTQQPEGGK